MPAGGAVAQEPRLGTVTFPTSARSPEAQAHFLRGVAALHSFWYPVALAEFQAATAIEPGFMMGYWGEAMAHNHPVWGDPQETDAARKVLEKIRETPNLTPRERAYLRAVQLLYGQGDKLDRDKAYASAMEQIHREHPGDPEAAAFHALALLGTVRHGDPASLRIRMRAAAIASDLYRREPDHPGAAHYILHAFDDADHAILALPAARRYAEIAPGAGHALHMPSHIFLQLGMWAEAATSNEASWAASQRWVERQKLPISKRDHHSLHWLSYAYLQQGRYAQVEELVGLMTRSLPEYPKDNPRDLAYGAYLMALMAASFIAETEQWDAAERLLPSAPDATGPAASSGADPYQVFRAFAATPAVFARGLAGAMRGTPEAQESISALRATRDRQTPETKAILEGALGVSLDTALQIQEFEIAAAASAAAGQFDEAIQLIGKAAALEETMPPPPGPPPSVKPAHELAGEILLRAGRPAEAAQQFATALFRHPDRARSLLGAARAAAQIGDAEGATDLYSRFARQWQVADAQLPERREAQEYLQRANVR
jgi:tetratricopeptide (TPR) repeat protein